jgi:Sec-independent protein translocase protein TatA
MAYFIEWDNGDGSIGELEAQSYIAANPAFQDTPVITQEMYDLAVYEGTNYTESEIALEGIANSPAVISDNRQTTNGSAFNTANSLMGAVVGFANNVTMLARNAGTAVGTVKRTITTAEQEYKTAERNAETGNKLQQWVQYSSTQDKLTVVIGLAGLAFLLLSPSK